MVRDDGLADKQLGEAIQTLDGNQRKLTPSMLCICDENKPVCVAGVMGGANSEIVGDTAMVLFESANFNGTSVHRTAAALNMRTDASSRYEKGLDPMNTLKAVERACELVELLGAGEVVEGVMDVIAKDSNPVTVKLEPEKVNGLLGTDVSREEMVRILEALDFKVEGDTIHVPSWRSDVEHYSDIAEEVARFYGYNNIPDTLSNGLTARRGLTDIQQTENLLGSVCRAAGYDEIITYSFISPTYYDKIDLPKDSALRDSLKILNPQGRTPWGNSGWHPNGIRIGGQSMHRTAMMVAGERKFRDFRKDNKLDTRQFQMAFRALRQLSAQERSAEKELDVDATIHDTCESAGRLEIRYKNPRKNTVKVLLLMDSGGSMDYYSGLCSQLFQAATKSNHFKELHTYYFHNCIYGDVYNGPRLWQDGQTPTEWLLQNFDAS